MNPRYVGRFAPSPTGPLHAGSLVAALASWLDARAHGGQWLVRIEDVDTPRCVPGMDAVILRQLATCGLHADAPPWLQSLRGAVYQKSLAPLVQRGLAYPCACSRKDIETAWAQRGRPPARHAELVYPGTCRNGLHGRAARAWRLRVGGSAAPGEPSLASTVAWQDRRLGPQVQDVAGEVGDFILRRADGLWAYQLAVVVDDAAQGVTHVVRGEDLADNTPRQILLQRALGLPMPHYLHTPLVLGENGEKLSKQNGAQPLDLTTPESIRRSLQQAAAVLGLPVEEIGSQAARGATTTTASTTTALAEQLSAWTAAWPRRYPLTAPPARPTVD